MTFYLERFLQFGTAWFLLWVSAAGQSGGVAPPLQATLEPKQSEWVLGVPVEFTVSVTNVSSAPVQTRTHDLRPEWGEMSLFISEDGSNFRGFMGPGWETWEGLAPKTPFNPGDKVQASFSLLWNGPSDTTGLAPTQGFAFPHSGTCFVKVKVFSDVGDLMSNVARVVIRQPLGNDAAIWEALKANKRMALYYVRPNLDDAVAGEGEKLQQLFNRYPSSSHTATMKKALAEYARQKAQIEETKKAKGNPQQQR